MHERNARMHKRAWAKGAVGALVQVCICAGLVSGCARAHAKAIPSGPTLNMPAPPPREVEAFETDVPQPVPLPEEPARTPLRPRPTPRPEQPRAEAAKPETPKPADTLTPIEAAKPAEELPKPPITLQTTPAAEQGVVERAIHATLTHATADLNRIDYRALNANARAQYDTAKRFIQQAEDAIRAKNLVLAKNLADKAAAIAAQQAGR